MPRSARVAPAGFVYHVLNRSAGGMHLFRKEPDFEAFERVMAEAHQRQPIRILSYCVLSNHWHFVVWPEEEGQLTDFFRRLAQTHAVRWRVSHRTVGYGQGQRAL
jgi:putative transposase